MRVAVVGGEGYLGHHLCKYFSADSLSRRNGFDITDSGIVNRLGEYEVIMHMAALVDKSEKKPEEVFRVNSGGTLNIVRNLKPHQTLIFASTKEVHNPEDAYSFSKAIAEQYVEYFAKHNGFKAGIFRLATTYAPPTNGKTFVNKFVDMVKGGQQINLAMKGQQVRDFLYVDDLADAFERFIESDLRFGVWDIGGGNKNSFNFLDFVNLIGQVSGKSPVVSFSDEPVRGQVSYVTDLEKISRDLTWSPSTSLRKGLELISL